LRPGETLLLHGATSGIGVTAIQLAKALGARVIASSRGAEKAARAQALGADLSIDSTAQDWVQAVKDAGGRMWRWKWSAAIRWPRTCR